MSSHPNTNLVRRAWSPGDIVTAADGVPEWWVGYTVIPAKAGI
jgi:hypothetical protein